MQLVPGSGIRPTAPGISQQTLFGCISEVMGRRVLDLSAAGKKLQRFILSSCLPLRFNFQRRCGGPEKLGDLKDSDGSSIYTVINVTVIQSKATRVWEDPP